MSMRDSKRRSHIELNRRFVGWCTREGVSVKSNDEVFFVDDKMLIRPEYLLNDVIYVDILKVGEFNPDNIRYYQQFANSFGTIILIKEEHMSELDDITKDHLIDKHGIFI